MDKFFHDDYDYKVNMGSKKDLDKKALMQKSQQEREKRQLQRLQNESAQKLQRYARRHLVNQQLLQMTLAGQGKVAQNVKAVLKYAREKQNLDKGQVDAIVEKTLLKLMPQLVLVVRLLGSVQAIRKWSDFISDLVQLLMMSSGSGPSPNLPQDCQESLNLLVFLVCSLATSSLNFNSGASDQKVTNLKQLLKDFIIKVQKKQYFVKDLQKMSTYILKQQIDKIHETLSSLNSKYRASGKLPLESQADYLICQKLAVCSHPEGIPDSLLAQLFYNCNKQLLKQFEGQEQLSQFVRVRVQPWLSTRLKEDSQDRIFQYKTVIQLLKQSEFVVSDLQLKQALADIFESIAKVAQAKEGAEEEKSYSNWVAQAPFDVKEVIEIIEKDVITLYWHQQDQNMEGMKNINVDCTLLNKILKIMSLKSFSQHSSLIEREIIYTPFLNQLYEYIEITFSSFTEQRALLRDMIRADEDILNLFCFIMQKRLIVLDDFEFQGKKKNQSAPSFLTVSQVKFASYLLNLVSYLVFQSSASVQPFSADFQQNLKKCTQRLYDRDKRIGLFPADFWTVENFENAEELNPEHLLKTISDTLLQNAPQTIPFRVRALIFKYKIAEEKDENQYGFMYSQTVEVRREFMLEDAFEKIYPMGSAAKSRFRIQFVDYNYQVEEGVDGGGLFKEFITKLSEIIFDPQYAFFTETQQTRNLYPSYLSQDLPNYLSYHIQIQIFRYFKFFGMIVGKALYEGTLLKCSFAKFFLNKMVQKSNSLDDLKELDPEIYNNLIFLKYYEGNVEDLGLTFEVNESIFGKNQTIALEKNGRNIPVTNQNKFTYIVKYANYILNEKVRWQVSAFVEGLQKVISPEQLSFFYPEEIQTLISGGYNEIDIEDLRKNCAYNGYSDSDPYIQTFWELLASLSNEEKEKFLQFVTGSNRPPLLGFRYLNPKFCISIQQVDPGEERLPTASTCMNMLRLPHYGNLERLKKNVLYAIRAEAGFGFA